jgi:hypothetical protein
MKKTRDTFIPGRYKSMLTEQEVAAAGGGGEDMHIAEECH